ncbi:hypothetical protein Hanom_Chr16g01499111 [Helianthus anomalus]
MSLICHDHHLVKPVLAQESTHQSHQQKSQHISEYSQSLIPQIPHLLILIHTNYQVINLIHEQRGRNYCNHIYTYTHIHIYI